jgi:hypothetical protein
MSSKRSVAFEVMIGKIDESVTPECQKSKIREEIQNKMGSQDDVYENTQFNDIFHYYD